jgi:uncharacterized membrane protein YeaQ/YmgE (transglycosylase-associated protein family)
MEIASWLIVGLATGSMARVAMPGPAAGGMPVAILIGLAGAFIGGSLGSTISPDTLAPFHLYAVATATIGALVLLFCYRCIAMRFNDPTHARQGPHLRKNARN